MIETNILIVDDNEDIVFAAEVILNKHFKNVSSLSDTEKVPELVKAGLVDLILLDMNFKRDASSGTEGIECLKEIKRLNASVQVVMMTAYGSLDVAVNAMKFGAADFIVKPWSNERLLTTVMNVAEKVKSTRRLSALEQMHKLETNVSSDFIYESDEMKNVYQLIKRAAVTEADILLLGESGTGKEVVAKAIHRLSKRAKEAFIGVDMGAIPESLFESDLFGHVKGAFTGAADNKDGRFIAADNGTLFLDEIGNLPLNLQLKLLRVLQNREVVPVGARRAIRTDIRLICATNENLTKNSSEGTFRQDLLYRINTIEILIPPLRERKADIMPLVEHFLGIYSKKYRKKPPTLSQKAKVKLIDWHWPGNVRELQHLMERLLILSEQHGTVDIDLIPDASDSQLMHSQHESKGLSLLEIEKNAIKNAMKSAEGNVSKAASILGLNRASLYRRLNKYNL